MKQLDKLLKLGERFQSKISKADAFGFANPKSEWEMVADIKQSLDDRLTFLLKAIALQLKGGGESKEELSHHLDKAIPLAKMLVKKLEDLKASLV